MSLGWDEVLWSHIWRLVMSLSEANSVPEASNDDLGL